MKSKKELFAGTALLAAFIVWTILIQTIDVQAVGVNGTKIGFAAINTRFHKLTGVHLKLYAITDWLGFVPLCICASFGAAGLRQLIKRKNIFKVDASIILLGIYYALVIFAYLAFEMIPINFRPILIGGVAEASYPSSTTLLVLSIMPSLKYQTALRCKNASLRNIVNVFSAAFSTFMIVGRSICGVHWCTDIIGAVLLSTGLFKLYLFSVGFAEQREFKQDPEVKNGIQ